MAIEKIIDNNPEDNNKNKESTKNDVEEISSDLRPKILKEYVGQINIVTSLKTAIQASEARSEAMDHVLFHGPPGLGKTTLAHVIAKEKKSNLVVTSGPSLEKPADIVGLLSNLGEGDVLFIDEIHRISKGVEEYFYSAMEDFKVDFITGSGTFAKTLTFPLKRFTLVGATTRVGMLSSPLRDRFGLTYHLDFYSEDELTEIVNRSSGILDVFIEQDASQEIAIRSRGTPRIANRLLRRVRDHHQVNHKGKKLDKIISSEAMELEGVDSKGLDRLDRQYLITLSNNYNGGPAGIEALAATLNEEAQTLIDVVEPYLLKIGFIIRTPSGRKVTLEGLRYLGENAKNEGNSQGSMF
ncbi:MAG: Holliday junction branch migration DNA helicase RuvB [Chloroflexi bacterium]|nr:Holliday junction branch migration DNA helicase RuvB [Chloroflexota bacterium]|tara:strand:+ start:2868 stop:3929 length:1062 start_codon:yes stop_codon:yes gene_type:complete